MVIRHDSVRLYFLRKGWCKDVEGGVKDLCGAERWYVEILQGLILDIHHCVHDQDA